jgi:hypothetical protein
MATTQGSNITEVRNVLSYFPQSRGTHVTSNSQASRQTQSNGQ